LTSKEDGTPDVVEAAGRWALEKQALEPVLLDVRGLCSYTDYLLILGGRTARQVKAVAEAILRGMRSEGYKPFGSEGLDEARWVLLDFGDVVIHVFQEDLRDFYDLESLWVDAKRRELRSSGAAASASAAGARAKA
jgi:ribosome-associated protein